MSAKEAIGAPLVAGDRNASFVAGDGTHYDVSGSAGPVVVLVHGLGLNRHMWRWQTGALMQRYRVITYDLYGHAGSPPPPAIPSLTVFSDQLLALLDDLRIAKAAVAGFSLGGMIARRFAMDHPDRLWALAILNSPYQRDAAAREAIQARVHQARRDGPRATVDAALQRWFTKSYIDSHPDIADLIRTWVLANDPAIYPDNYQVLVDGVDELVAPASPIACPALVMTAEEDYGNSPAMTRSIAAEMADARTVILPGLRHMAMIEAPEVFNRPFISFLNAVTASAP